MERSSLPPADGPPIICITCGLCRKASDAGEERHAVHIVKAEEKQGSSIPSTDGQSVVRVGRKQLESRLIVKNLIVGNVAVVRKQ
jgi:hypothetical protein